MGLFEEEIFLEEDGLAREGGEEEGGGPGGAEGEPSMPLMEEGGGPPSAKSTNVPVRPCDIFM